MARQHPHMCHRNLVLEHPIFWCNTLLVGGFAVSITLKNVGQLGLLRSYHMQFFHDMPWRLCQTMHHYASPSSKHTACQFSRAISQTTQQKIELAPPNQNPVLDRSIDINYIIIDIISTFCLMMFESHLIFGNTSEFHSFPQILCQSAGQPQVATLHLSAAFPRSSCYPGSSNHPIYHTSRA